MQIAQLLLVTSSSQITAMLVFQGISPPLSFISIYNMLLVSGACLQPILLEPIMVLQYQNDRIRVSSGTRHWAKLGPLYRKHAILQVCDSRYEIANFVHQSYHNGRNFNRLFMNFWSVPVHENRYQKSITYHYPATINRYAKKNY